MSGDLLSLDFRMFKKKSERVRASMTDEEVARVRLALQYLVASFDRELAARALQGRKSA